jgi:hypothetical protein
MIPRLHILGASGSGKCASMSVSRAEGSITSSVMHVPLGPEHAFLVGGSGSCPPAYTQPSQGTMMETLYT